MHYDMTKSRTSAITATRCREHPDSAPYVVSFSHMFAAIHSISFPHVSAATALTCPAGRPGTRCRASCAPGPVCGCGEGGWGWECGTKGACEEGAPLWARPRGNTWWHACWGYGRRRGAAGRQDLQSSLTQTCSQLSPLVSCVLMCLCFLFGYGEDTHLPHSLRPSPTPFPGSLPRLAPLGPPAPRPRSPHPTRPTRPRLPRPAHLEQRLECEQLCEDAAGRPHVHRAGVVPRAQQQLGGAVWGIWGGGGRRRTSGRDEQERSRRGAARGEDQRRCTWYDTMV